MHLSATGLQTHLPAHRADATRGRRTRVERARLVMAGFVMCAPGGGKGGAQGGVERRAEVIGGLPLWLTVGAVRSVRAALRVVEGVGRGGGAGEGEGERERDDARKGSVVQRLRCVVGDVGREVEGLRGEVALLKGRVRGLEGEVARLERLRRRADGKGAAVKDMGASATMWAGLSKAQVRAAAAVRQAELAEARALLAESRVRDLQGDALKGGIMTSAVVVALCAGLLTSEGAAEAFRVLLGG